MSTQTVNRSAKYPLPKNNDSDLNVYQQMLKLVLQIRDMFVV